MKKTEFIEVLKDNASKYGEVLISEMSKGNYTYTGLHIKVPAGTPAPVVNIDEAYKKYSDGEWSLDRCIDFLDHILNQKMEEPFDRSWITDWDKAKERLYIRLFGNITDGIYREVEDMYMVPYLQVSDDGTATVRVTNALLELWGISEDDVFYEARENQESMRPVKICSIADMLRIKIPGGEPPFYVISTENFLLGAGAIFYDGVFDKLREKIGEDFYILPSSVHEMIAVPKSLNDDVEELRQMVTAINGNEVEERDRLTNSVYTFDFDTYEFKKVA